ncbi:MAG: hypothetical protein ACTSXL_00245 [Alphaproteobacteria bacterium]
MKTFLILFFCLSFASFQSRANLLLSLQQEKKVLLQKNISLKNKNLDLKKQKQKLKKAIKRLGVATGILAGTTVGTFIAGGIAKNKKNEKNTDAENIIKKLQDPNQNLTAQNPHQETCRTKEIFTCLTPQNITVEIPKGTNVIIEKMPSYETPNENTVVCKTEPVKTCAKPVEPIKTVANNCSLTTNTIFEAIDNNNLKELQCWLAKNPDAINSKPKLLSKTDKVLNATNPLAYALGKGKSNEIILEFIKQKPELIYTELAEKPLLTWLFDERHVEIIQEIYDVTKFDINYEHSILGSLKILAMHQSKTSTALLDFLQNNGADMTKDTDNTPLIIKAIILNRPKGIEFLFKNSYVQAGTKLNGSYKMYGSNYNFNNTPLLHFAYKEGKNEACIKLVEYVDFNIKDQNEETISGYIENKAESTVTECWNAISKKAKELVDFNKME